MKRILPAILALLVFSSCYRNMGKSSFNQYEPLQTDNYNYNPYDTAITQSLFTDRNATISEENIQRILNGQFNMPANLRVAILKIESPSRYWHWSDEEYVKIQEQYISSFTEKLKKSPRVSKVTLIPMLLISKKPGITQIREAATRLQCDVVVVFTSQSDIYYKYRLLSKTQVKAYATSEMIMMDVRTGLVPYTEVITRDFMAEKKQEDAGLDDTRGRALREAVILTINELSQKFFDYLSQNNGAV
jgi:hypothetical protein